MLAWLIRHAESQSNVGLASADPAAIPLTEQGWSQARHLAARFVEPPSLIVTSAYERTKQTARPTRERFPDVPHQEWPVQEFTYLPSLHGRLTTAAQRRPMVEAYFLRADPSYIERPGGESFSGLLSRAREVIERLRGCGDEPVAIFSHGLFMRAVLWTLLVEPGTPTPESMRRFRAFTKALAVPNTAVIDLCVGSDGKTLAVLGGCVTHLPAALVTGT